MLPSIGPNRQLIADIDNQLKSSARVEIDKPIPKKPGRHLSGTLAYHLTASKNGIESGTLSINNLTMSTRGLNMVSIEVPSKSKVGNAPGHYNNAKRVRADKQRCSNEHRYDHCLSYLEQGAFGVLKAHEVKPPIMMVPNRARSLKLYISATDDTLSYFLTQDDKEAREGAVYYLSRIMSPIEQRWKPIKKMCLALYFAAHGL
ncbi:hypothetical protein ACH5RR_040505 [Cinchona calisaya]|uniref:Reverse transcriptase/retrotransposon-derived protein RNase H-like domain-containing protein n=1 Tax=Cinchona calisaya TaxID=153742 RepID=A0ABD2XSH1_9GENT